MFCSKCGNEIPSEALFCSKCGNRILSNESKSETKDIKLEKDDDQNYNENLNEQISSEIKLESVSYNKEEIVDDPYVFWGNGEKREMINGVIKFAIYVPILLIGYQTWKFINYTMDTSYPFVSNILNFLMETSIYFVLFVIILGLSSISRYKESNLVKGYNKSKFLALKVAEIICGVAAFIPYLNPSELNMAQWSGRILIGGLGNILTCFSIPIICFIIVCVIDHFKRKSFVVKDLEDILDEI